MSLTETFHQFQVGKFYRVPTVKTTDIHRPTGYVPIIGPLHSDAEIIKFPHEHWAHRLALCSEGFVGVRHSRFVAQRGALLRDRPAAASGSFLGSQGSDRRGIRDTAEADEVPARVPCVPVLEGDMAH